MLGYKIVNERLEEWKRTVLNSNFTIRCQSYFFFQWDVNIKEINTDKSLYI